MKNKKIVILFFATIMVFYTFMIFLNILIDPLLKFGSINAFNEFFPETIEREQKTNLVHRTAKEYDSVLFGSSRTANINQNDFLGMKVFNYAFSMGNLYEFKPYLDFFASYREPKNIIIGLDYFQTNKKMIDAENPQNYIDRARDKYSFILLLTNDIMNFSLKFFNYKCSTKACCYNRYNVKFQPKVSLEQSIKSYQSGLPKRFKHFGVNYIFNDEIFLKYQQIKENYPKSKIIAFTNPIHSDFFATYMKKGGHFEKYKKWIKELVDIYGEIYAFMGINSVTTNFKNYADEDHYYPEVGKIIAYKLSTMDFESEPKDFGVIVNKDNVDEFLTKQEKELQEYEFSEFYPHDEINKILEQK